MAVHWATFVEVVRADCLSGAAELAGKAATAVLEWIDCNVSRSWAAWTADLKALAIGLAAAQPAMAPLFNLTNDILLALESGGVPEHVRAGVRQSVQAFLLHSRQAHTRLAEAALELFPEEARVLTYSYSSSVLAVLLEAHAQRRLSRVFCTEGRPMMEGQHLAQALATAGVAVEFGIDAAISAFAPQASMVLVGSDSLTERGVVNKLGTTSLALMSRHTGLPCYVIGDRQKWLPAAAPPLVCAHPKPEAQVWATPPGGIVVWNAYFECTPLQLFDGIIGEGEVRTPEKLLMALRDLPIAEALRAGGPPGEAT